MTYEELMSAQIIILWQAGFSIRKPPRLFGSAAYPIVMVLFGEQEVCSVLDTPGGSVYMLFPVQASLFSTVYLQLSKIVLPVLVSGRGAGCASVHLASGEVPLNRHILVDQDGFQATYSESRGVEFVSALEKLSYAGKNDVDVRTSR